MPSETASSRSSITPSAVVRSIAAIAAGMVAWTVLWLGSNGALASALPGSFREDGSTESIGILLIILISSVVYSILAGYITAATAARSPIAHGFALGLVQTAIGVAVQMQYWELMPLWYHLFFLGLLLPGNLAGAWIRRDRDRVRAPMESTPTHA